MQLYLENREVVVCLIFSQKKMKGYFRHCFYVEIHLAFFKQLIG